MDQELKKPEVEVQDNNLLLSVDVDIDPDTGDFKLPNEVLEEEEEELDAPLKKPKKVDGSIAEDEEDFIEGAIEVPDEEFDESEDGTPELQLEDNSEEEVDDEEESSEAAPKDDNVNLINAFAEDLREKEFFPDLTDEEINSIDSVDDLLELSAKQNQIIVENWKSEVLNNEVNILREMVNRGELSVDQLPPAADISEESITDEAKAEKFLRDYHKMIGTKQKVVDQYIERSLDVVADAKETVKDYNEARLKQEERMQEQIKVYKKQRQDASDKMWNDIKSTLENTVEFIPGVKVNKKVRERALNGVQGAYQKVNGNPNKYGGILALLDEYGLLDGNFDKVAKLGESLATSKLSKVIKSKQSRSTKTSNDTNSSNLEQRIQEAAKYSLKRKNK